MRGGLGAASKQREGECVFSRTRAALAVPFTMKGGAVHCGPARQGEGASDQHTPRGAGGDGSGAASGEQAEASGGAPWPTRSRTAR